MNNKLLKYNNNFNHQMLLMARQSRNLSQKDFCRLTFINQGYLSKIENGLYEPPNETVEKFSNVLNYPVSFFYNDFKYYSLDMNYYRKFKSVKIRKLDEINSYANLIRIQIEKLLSSIEVEFNIPEKKDLENTSKPEDLAIVLRNFWKIPKGPIDNLIKLLENNGIIIVFKDFGNSSISGFKTKLEKYPHHIIFVNSSMPVDRIRFTLAHELGHIILHDFPNDNMENEADKFASEFLMPTSDIRGQLINLNFEKLFLLKKIWKTSMASILRKALDTKAISEDFYKKWNINFAKRGYRKEEPLSSILEKEEPSLLKEMVNYYIHEYKYSIEELSEFIYSTKEEMFSEYGLSSNNNFELLSDQ